MADKKRTNQAGRTKTQAELAALRRQQRGNRSGINEQIQRQRRKRKVGFISLWTTVGLVAVLVVVLIVVQQAGSKNDTKDVNSAAPASLVNDLASVPVSVFNEVGAGGFGKTVAGLSPISGSPATTDGKPTLIFVGGEFCPYCAAQRWVLVTALDRFGSFTGLETGRSAADDGNYATLSFVHAKYASQYLVFDGKEIYDRARKNLQTLDATAEASYKKFGQVGSVPYFSVNNAFTGSYQYPPEEIGTLSAGEIAAQVNAGESALAKDIIAAANILTAGICKETNAMPSTVCASSGVSAAAKVGLSSVGAS